MNRPVETEIVTVPQDEKGSIEITPLGTDERIKLSIKIVQTMIAQPTRSGKLPDANECVKFMMLCKAKHLNPFEGDAFMLGYDTQSGPKFSQITAHQVFLKRAEASKSFNGFESGVVVEMKDGNIEEHQGDIVMKGEILIGGWCRVYRKDRDVPFYKRLKLSVFDTQLSRWAKDPAGMIVKCAEADALRTAFPTHLGGLLMMEELPPIDVGPVIQRAEVPKIKDLGGAVSQQSESSPPVEGAGVPFDSVIPAVSVAAPPSESSVVVEKKTEPVKRKKKADPLTEVLQTNIPDHPNHAAMIAFLTLGGFTFDDLMKVALKNKWITEDQTWPLSEDVLARFLTDTSKAIVMEELQALPPKVMEL